VLLDWTRCTAALYNHWLYCRLWYCIVKQFQKPDLQPPAHHNRFTAHFPGPPGWAGARKEVLEWTLWCKGRLTEADTPIIRLGATPSSLTSAHLHHPPIFLQAGCPSCRPTNSVKVMQPNNKKQLRTSVPPKIVYSEEAESLNSIINNSRTGDIM